MTYTRSLVYNILAFVLVLTVLLPGTSSLAHTFENHEHFTQCDNPEDVHVHEQSLECDFNLILLKDKGIIAFAKAALITPHPSDKTTITYVHTSYIYDLETRNSRGPPSC